MDLLTLLSDNPALRALQLALLVIAAMSVFLVLYTTRDVLQRSASFWFQLFAIILVACLPIVGFLLYVLIRPVRTLWEQELLQDVHKLLEKEKRKADKPKAKGDMPSVDTEEKAKKAS